MYHVFKIFISDTSASIPIQISTMDFFVCKTLLVLFKFKFKNPIKLVTQKKSFVGILNVFGKEWVSEYERPESCLNPEEYQKI